jgi:aquaporin Z
MVMVYAGAHLAGGHYNPAVTLAVLVRRRIGLREAIEYWAVQLGHVLLAAFASELLFTIALCYVVLNVATSCDHPDNSYYGAAIGFTVMAGAIAVGTVSAGAFNPSVTPGAAVMGIFAWPTLWVYMVAQVVAGLAAGVTFMALNPDDK